MYYVQKNVTISKEQEKFIRSNHGKMSISQLAKMLGLTPNKTHHNMRAMGLTKKRTTKVVTMEGYFDVDKFGKLYNF